MRSRFSVQPSGHTSECFQILPMYGRQEVLTAKLWQVNSNDESNGSFDRAFGYCGSVIRGWSRLVAVKSVEPWFFWIVYFSGSLSVPSKCFLVISSNTWTSKHINMIRDQTWIFMIIQKKSLEIQRKCFQKFFLDLDQLYDG